jgi:hypothetical protein
VLGSEALEFENLRNPDLERREFAQAILMLAAETVPYTPEIARREGMAVFAAEHDPYVHGTPKRSGNGEG